MSTPTADPAHKTVAHKKEHHDGGDKELFNQWKTRKPSDAGLTLKPDVSNRRRSVFKTLTHLNSIRRMTLTNRAKSDISNEIVKPQVIKENTYKMKPDVGTKFSPMKIENVIQQLLRDEVAEMEYDHDVCGRLSCDIAEKIRERIKDLQFPRYKIVANVIISKMLDQGIEAASRSCWDDTTDNFTSVTYQNKSLFVIALIYGVYYE